MSNVQIRCKELVITIIPGYIFDCNSNSASSCENCNDSISFFFCLILAEIGTGMCPTKYGEF